MPIFYTVAGLIVIVLAVIAGYYLVLLGRQQQRINAESQRAEQELAEVRKRANNSIQILARGATQGQLTLTEASIRISKLMDNLAVDTATRDEFAVFFLLAEKTSHIPILAEWKQLSRKQQFKFDLERQELEHQYSEQVIDAAQRLQGKVF